MTRVAPATLHHVDAIRAIYNDAILTTAATFDLEPKPRDDRVRWLTERPAAHPVVVALDDAGGVSGWGSLAAFSERAAWSRTVEDAVYVAADRRGRGIGDAILGELMRLARAHRHHVVVARIVGGNEASLRLHRRHGFIDCGTLREVGWKFERWHDVVMMQAMVEA